MTTKDITLKAGENHSFELETHTGGGYLWQVASSDEHIAQVQVKASGASFDIQKSPLGKSLPVSVVIQAVGAGSCTAVLEERRTWMKDEAPLNICKVHIIVE